MRRCAKRKSSSSSSADGRFHEDASHAIGVCLVILAMTVQRAAATRRAPEAEAPTLDVTRWTDKTELFMEYPPLVAGQEALFAVHLTRLSDFSAMTAGRPRLEFTPESGGTPAVLQGQRTVAPRRVPGARARRRRPAVTVGRSSSTRPASSDAHDLGAITVFADQADGGGRRGIAAPPTIPRRSAI